MRCAHGKRCVAPSCPVSTPSSKVHRPTFPQYLHPRGHPTLNLSNVARWSQRRRLQRTLSRTLSEFSEYQLANSYRGMKRMYAKYRTKQHCLPPSPLDTAGHGGGTELHARPKRSTFTGSYSELSPAPPALPNDMRYFKGVSGTGRVGIGSSRLQTRFGPGVGSGLFAITTLRYNGNRSLTKQIPICSYRSHDDSRITYESFQARSNIDCTHIWSQSVPMDGTPPPLDWVYIDAAEPSSCYGRYANDPFNEEMVNEKLEYDPKSDTVNLYPIR